MKLRLSLLSLLLALSFVERRLLRLAVFLLAAGIFLGAIWANVSWGSYWSWDPKETWSLITWIIYAIYLHLRFNKGWKGRVLGLMGQQNMTKLIKLKRKLIG